MSKASKRMFSNLYENNIMDLDTVEDLEEVAPIKSNKAMKKAKRSTISINKNGTSQGKNIIVTKPVDATCNKCGAKITGELIGDIYLPHADKLMPFISYNCDNCGHKGRRSVFTLALPAEQYERKYFN